MKAKRRFYEEMYREGRIPPPPSGVIGKLFLKLRRFELSRTQAVFPLLPRGERLLDLGCGEGFLMALAKKEKFKQVYGVDIAQNAIDKARRTFREEFPRAKKGVYFKLVDVDEGIPFPDGFFDAVVAAAFLEHVFDPYFVISEIKRVLKKDGIFILEVPNCAWLPRRMALFLGKLPKTADEMGWDGGHLHYFTFKSLEDLLVKEGFKVLTKTCSGIFSCFRQFYPSLLGANIIIKARKKGKRLKLRRQNRGKML